MKTKFKSWIQRYIWGGGHEQHCVAVPKQEKDKQVKHGNFHVFVQEIIISSHCPILQRTATPNVAL
jgi:hypothetical protein